MPRRSRSPQKPRVRSHVGASSESNNEDKIIGEVGFNSKFCDMLIEINSIFQYNVILLEPTEGGSVDRLSFDEKKPAAMADCTGRIKSEVKFISLNYATRRNAEKKPIDKIAYV